MQNENLSIIYDKTLGRRGPGKRPYLLRYSTSSSQQTPCRTSSFQTECFPCRTNSEAGALASRLTPHSAGTLARSLSQEKEIRDRRVTMEETPVSYFRMAQQSTQKTRGDLQSPHTHLQRGSSFNAAREALNATRERLETSTP